MAGIRELRGRIKSVGNIKQITRAMEMVATTKLRRFQDRAVASRPYAEEITKLVSSLAAKLGDEVADRPLFRPGTGERTAVMVVTSDRGLCGAYNSNVLRELEDFRASAENPDQVDYFVYGRRGYQYLGKRGIPIERFFHDPPLEQLTFQGAAYTARVLREAFEAGTYKEVRILYTAFESMVRFVPTWIPFLPILPGSLGASDEDSKLSGDILLEPDAATIFDSLVPRYLETKTYNALLESLTSEYASRRFSMKNATDAASDMQGELKTIYNRKRQETITKELLDIVGGAEAVK